MKHWLTAAFAALACGVAQASTWDVHYAHMQSDAGPAGTLDVFFSGTDANADGLLSADELGGLDYVFHWDSDTTTRYRYAVFPLVSKSPCGPYPECHSTLTAFAFSQTDRVLQDIDAEGLRTYDDSLWFKGSSVSLSGRITLDASTATVTVLRLRANEGIESMTVAVPEPATPALWALGLAAMAAGTAGRRRARATP